MMYKMKKQSNIVKILFTFVMLFSLLFVFTGCSSNPNKSPVSIMTEYGTLMSEYYNTGKMNYDKYEKLWSDTPVQKANFERTNSFIARDGVGKVTFAKFKEPLTQGKRTLCGVAFYNKSTGKIYSEHILILVNKDSKYFIEGSKLMGGVADKKLYDY